MASGLGLRVEGLGVRVQGSNNLGIKGTLFGFKRNIREPNFKKMRAYSPLPRITPLKVKGEAHSTVRL